MSNDPAKVNPQRNSTRDNSSNLATNERQGRNTTFYRVGPNETTLIDHSTNDHRRSINIRLKLMFAALSCMGGLVLASGSDGATLPVLAVFFAVFGFVFVDWLEFFALPAIAAYAAMGVAAMLCVGDFLELNAPGQHQMRVVAQLLVFVQAILMLQKKSRRIFEQLGVFCLLELIVAAVFNDAIVFGLLLIPIALTAAMALALISAKWVTEGPTEPLDSRSNRQTRGSSQSKSLLLVNSDANWTAVLQSAPGFSRVVLWMMAPAVLLIGIFFFYALPRTTDAARVESRGKAMVGFSDELRLGQIGQMMQSTKPAMRIHLRDTRSGEPYTVAGGLYLRGKVLERYEEFNSLTLQGASWKSLPSSYRSPAEHLPTAYIPDQSYDEAYYDSVSVKVVCESMRSDALFAIAPYHATQVRSTTVMHHPELWTLGRQGKADWIYPRIEYHFGTHAFRSGIQSEFISYSHHGRSHFKRQSDIIQGSSQTDAGDERRRQQYIDKLLIFPEGVMPTIHETAKSLVNHSDGSRRSNYAIAKAMTRHFSDPGRYQYTLNLNAEPVPGLDPIEQFVRIDKRGHCQYFASALAMMLRSQGIPARVIAGYHTDEYNELGRHYVARQLHAHAWVEALVEINQGDGVTTVFGQPETDRYWLRLDPTPPAGRVRETGRVGQVLDLAQTVWDDYIIDMDAEKQEVGLINGGSNSMNQSYRRVIDQLGLMISRLRAGELGGGSFAQRNWFSWQAALLSSLAIMTFIGFLRIRLVKKRRSLTQKETHAVDTPSLKFYAEAIQMVGRMGIKPQIGQTPKEFGKLAETKFTESGNPSIREPLRYLTDRFYYERFGNKESESDLAVNVQIADASSVMDNTNQAEGGIQAAETNDQTDRSATEEAGVEQALAELSAGIELILQRDSERKHSRDCDD